MNINAISKNKINFGMPVDEKAEREFNKTFLRWQNSRSTNTKSVEACQKGLEEMRKLAKYHTIFFNDSNADCFHITASPIIRTGANYRDTGAKGIEVKPSWFSKPTLEQSILKMNMALARENKRLDKSKGNK